jgi:hypothetical protein
MDDIGNGEGLPGTCYAKQNLVRRSFFNAFDKLRYGLFLVTLRFKFSNDLELVHVKPSA